MQSVKNVLRTIGQENPAKGVVSAEQAEMHLAALAKEGYELHSTMYLGSIRDDKNLEIGYRVLYVLVNNG